MIKTWFWFKANMIKLDFELFGITQNQVWPCWQTWFWTMHFKEKTWFERLNLLFLSKFTYPCLRGKFAYKIDLERSSSTNTCHCLAGRRISTSVNMMVSSCWLLAPLALAGVGSQCEFKLADNRAPSRGGGRQYCVSWKQGVCSGIKCTVCCLSALRSTGLSPC